MANSSVIGAVKSKIARELIKDDAIVRAIDASDVDAGSPEKLINTHIFNYNQNPYTLSKAGTFVTIQVHLPQSPEYDFNKTFMVSSIEIWIVSHERHMAVNNVPKVTQNRNDYLAELIDGKLNGRPDFGIGVLKLRSNIEGSFQQDYLFRKMVFEGVDLNDSLCDAE